MPALSPQGNLYSTAQSWQFKTDGHAIISAPKTTMLLDAQDLAHIVGRQANPSTDIDNADGDNNAATGIDYPKWLLAQAHFHWYAQRTQLGVACFGLQTLLVSILPHTPIRRRLATQSLIIVL